MTTIIPEKIGLLLPLSDSEYGVSNGVRKSQLDLISVSPATARQGFKEQTDAMIMGSLVHCLVLQPELFDSEYIISPNFDLRTKSGKEDSQLFEFSAIGKTIINSDDYKKALKMRDSALNVVGDFLDISDAIIENAAFWKDSETGVLCKCKPDIYIPSIGVAIDLKTTAGFATADYFGKSVKSFRYHVQQAFYTQGLQSNGFEVNNFLFVPVSKGESANCRAFQLDNSVVEYGNKLMRDDLNLWAYCEQTNNWQRKPSQIETIKFKPWEIPQNDK